MSDERSKGASQFVDHIDALLAPLTTEDVMALQHEAERRQNIVDTLAAESKKDRKRAELGILVGHYGCLAEFFKNYRSRA